MTKIQNHRLFFVGGLGMPNLKFVLLVLSSHGGEKKAKVVDSFICLQKKMHGKVQEKV